MKKVFLITVLLFLSTNTFAHERRFHKAAKDTYSPWSVSQKDPVIKEERSLKKSELSSIGTSPFVWVSWIIDLYGLTSSSDSSCNFHPTCSKYTKKAIVKHGGIIGLIMGAERIMRYHHDFKFYDLFPLKGGYKLYDPVELNDFWY